MMPNWSLEKMTEFRRWLTQACFDARTKLGMADLDIALILADEMRNRLSGAQLESHKEE